MKKILQKTVDLAVVTSIGSIVAIATSLVLSPFATFVVVPIIMLTVGAIGYVLHQVAAKAPDKEHLFEQLLKELHIQEFVHRHIHH